MLTNYSYSTKAKGQREVSHLQKRSQPRWFGQCAGQKSIARANALA